MKIQFLFLLFLFILILDSCKSVKEVSINNLYTPPGTVKIHDNFYIDQSEITNLNYLEFVNWVGRVYGKESSECKKISPDTSVWKELGMYYNGFSNYYFKHPSYRNAPVIGVSYDQANLYCQWRADRVMEFVLIRDGIIKYNSKPMQDSVFSIEKYFKGKYGKVSAHPFHQYYPEYSLPDSLTYINALIFADSLKMSLRSSTLKKQKTKSELEIRCYETIPDKNKTIPYSPNPMKVNSWPQGKMVVNLKGNVRELTSDQNWVFGGSYKDSCKTVNEIFFYPNIGPNCYTGFRSICRFLKWE